MIFDLPQLEYLVIGVSPTSFGESFFADPYPGECSGFLKNIFGNPIEKRYMAECIGQPMSPLDRAYLLFTVGVNQKHFFQFHQFVRTYLTERDQYQKPPTDIKPITNVNYDFVQSELFKLDAEMNRIRYNRSEVKDVVTGSNNIMNWSLRGLDKEFDEKSLTMQLLRNLRKSADLFGVKIIFYETPTPMTADAAHIYPNGFFEAYRQNLKQALASLKIPYLDYSQLLPWSSEYFNSYTDLTPLGKRVVSLKLLQDLRVLTPPQAVEIKNPQMVKPPPAPAPAPLKPKDTGLQDGLNFKINEAYE